MARTALTVQHPTFNGIVPTFSAANVDGHSIVNDGRTVLYVKNGGGAPINVTIDAPQVVGGVPLTDPVVAVAAGAEKIIGPFDARAFAQPTGVVNVDFSAITSVTVAAISTG